MDKAVFNVNAQCCDIMNNLIKMNHFTLKQFCLTCKQNVCITFRFHDSSGVARGNCKCGRPFFYVKLN